MKQSSENRGITQETWGCGSPTKFFQLRKHSNEDVAEIRFNLTEVNPNLAYWILGPSVPNSLVAWSAWSLGDWLRMPLETTFLCRLMRCWGMLYLEIWSICHWSILVKHRQAPSCSTESYRLEMCPFSGDPGTVRLIDFLKSWLSLLLTSYYRWNFWTLNLDPYNVRSGDMKAVLKGQQKVKNFLLQESISKIAMVYFLGPIEYEALGSWTNSQQSTAHT